MPSTSSCWSARRRLKSAPGGRRSTRPPSLFRCRSGATGSTRCRASASRPTPSSRSATPSTARPSPASDTSFSPAARRATIWGLAQGRLRDRGQRQVHQCAAVGAMHWRASRQCHPTPWASLQPLPENLGTSWSAFRADPEDPVGVGRGGEDGGRGRHGAGVGPSALGGTVPPGRQRPPQGAGL